LPFHTLREAEVLIEAWRRHYNTAKPHSALNYRPPAPEAMVARDVTLMPWPSAPAPQGARAASPAVASDRRVQ
jgi:putative transposase